MRYLPIRFLTIVVCLMPWTFALSAERPRKLDGLISSISAVLPPHWRLEQIAQPKHPYWLSSPPPEIYEIWLIGPEKSGYRYYLRSGGYQEILFRNEAIHLWVFAADFDDGWTFGKRLQNRTRKTPTELPVVLTTTQDFKVYAKPEWRVLDGKDPQPADTEKARNIQPTKGSWKRWEKNLAAALSQGAKEK